MMAPLHIQPPRVTFDERLRDAERRRTRVTVRMPVVTEIPLRLTPVTRDDFIDAPPYSTAPRSRSS